MLMVQAEVHKMEKLYAERKKKKTIGQIRLSAFSKYFDHIILIKRKTQAHEIVYCESI